MISVKLEHIDTINDSVTYSLELSRAEDIATNGDMADIMNIGLPNNFDPHDNVQWNKMIEKLKPYIEQGNFDTVLLKCESYKEKIFLVE